MKFEITVLGCGSATPTLRHWPTAQVVNHDEHYFLLDCGEGTQLQLRRFGIKFQRINHIFITHLHGDHCLGLPGLISTMHLLGRTNPLHIYAPEALRGAVELQLKISHSRLRFPIEWHQLSYSGENLLLETPKIQVFSFPLNHRVPCCGFRITEKPKLRNILPQMIEKYTIPIPRIRQIKEGADYKTLSGEIIRNEDLTLPPEPPKAYAFCTDSAYQTATAAYVHGVDLLYHEATFLESERDRARATFHSTVKDAARVAREAEVGKLLIGHYSARYRETEMFQAEGEDVFKPIILADEGMRIRI